MQVDDDQVIAATRRWVERAVIGLNLCPFAKAVQTDERIRYVQSEARTPDELIADLQRELETLAEATPEKIETTLLIHPHVLTDFLDYNDFLDVADGLVEALHLDGVLQVASFHPRYQFAGSGPDDVSNYSNRSPYPTLHLLREESIERAVEAMPDAEKIYQRNIETLQRIGHEGWDALKLNESDAKKHDSKKPDKQSGER